MKAFSIIELLIYISIMGVITYGGKILYSTVKFNYIHSMIDSQLYVDYDNTISYMGCIIENKDQKLNIKVNDKKIYEQLTNKYKTNSHIVITE